MKTLAAWIFDVYAFGPDMIVWVIDTDGQAYALRDRFAPSFYVGGDMSEQLQVAHWLVDQGWDVNPMRAEGIDLFLGCAVPVRQVQVNKPKLFTTIFERVTRLKPNLPYYNADIPVAQMYFLEKNSFPLAFCQFVLDDDNRIRTFETMDSPWALDYALPPLKRMGIRLEGDALNPNHGYRAALEIETEDDVRVLNGDEPREMLERLRDLLLRYDPDLIVSDWGDSYVLPHLLRLAKKYQVELPFNRDRARPPLFQLPHSYFSYGRIIYKTASQTLFGRWHIDRQNAFLADDYGLEGAFEVARLTGIPVQRVVRTSTGTGISAMEIATAYRRGVLIPWHKQEPESWKSAYDLVQSDKGGLVYQPVTGLHEEVAEIDFVSMYPSIMARFNISPETVNCKCCREHVVPELGYSVCEKQRGVVPETIEPLIRKRIAYKKRIKELAPDDATRELYRRRQSAHKWLLVTCFGYLGYKNARFGKIEAHESVTAYGRECLLQAKEVAERRGFRVLQANVDSLFVQKKGTPQSGYDALLEEITRVTQIPIALEGIYRWVAFLPSRQDAQMSVSNRYVGTFVDGELKMRGIETRRRDTPPFIVAAQIEMLKVLAVATSRREMEQKIPAIIEMACGYVDALRSGRVPYQDLVITKRLSKAVEAYTKDTQLAIAARSLTEQGVELSPGESLQYIITEQRARAPRDRVQPLTQYRGRESYDSDKYIELLLRAVETVLTPLGVSYAQIEESVKAGVGRKECAPRIPKRRSDSLGPLFDFAARQAAEQARRPRS